MAISQTYQNYFYNSKKLYEFRVKLANCEITKDLQEAIKNALDAYEVETISAAKRLPIQEHRDFHQLGACEVHHIDVALNYPTIAEQVRQLIINRARVPSSKVCVYTLNQALQEELVQATIDAQGLNGPVIENPELAAVDATAIAGQARVDSLLKELSKMPLSDTYEISGDDKTVNGTAVPKGTTNDFPQQNKSVNGSAKVKA